MTDPNPPRGGTTLACANCRRPLDPGDKFCRECGLPTLRQAETQRAVPAAPLDAREMKSALEAQPDPKPFTREGAVLTPPTALSPAVEPELTTGAVVRVTSPTQATQMAASTLLMVGLILVFVVVGVLLLFLAFRG